MEKHRFSLELPMRFMDLLVRVQQRIGASSNAEVIRRSLTVYAAVTQHASEGGQVVFRDHDGAERQMVVL